MRICPYCENSSPDDSVFCEFCGKKVLSEKQFVLLYEDLLSIKYDYEVYI